MSRYLMFFDGACPGGIPHFGWILETDDGKPVTEGNGPVFLLGTEQTTNIAEYGGLIHGLAGAIAHLKDGDALAVFGDSQLIVRQVNGWYRIKKEHLLPYVRKAHELIKALQEKKVTVSIDWVPRERNEKADRLSKRSTLTYPTDAERAPKDQTLNDECKSDE